MYRPLLPARNGKSQLLLMSNRDLLLSYHWCGSVSLRHVLALPAKLREIDTDDVHTVKRLLAVFIPDRLQILLDRRDAGDAEIIDKHLRHIRRKERRERRAEVDVLYAEIEQGEKNDDGLLLIPAML
jgi:hypothetical protein